MSGSVNKALIVGNLGEDPTIKTMQSGDKVASFSVATSESWKAKDGERKTVTQWHKIVVFNQGLINVCENYLKKGSKVYLEGQIETRHYEKDGQKIYTTEIVLRPFRGEITMLDSKGGNDASESKQAPSKDIDELEDTIPF